MSPSRVKQVLSADLEYSIAINHNVPLSELSDYFSKYFFQIIFNGRLTRASDGGLHTHP